VKPEKKKKKKNMAVEGWFLMNASYILLCMTATRNQEATSKSVKGDSYSYMFTLGLNK
jgi:hypothetical protein